MDRRLEAERHTPTTEHAPDRHLAPDEHPDRPAEHVGPGEHAHPRQGEYIRIAVILAVITAVEVAIYYVEAIRPILVPILLVLSALKFALVVLFFMHLKFDNKLFSYLFTGPLLLMVAVLFSLLALFSVTVRVVP